MEIWEALQGIGAIAGLGSASVLAWRYLTRNAPVAIITPRQPYEFSPKLVQYLEITNPADRPVILRFEDNSAQNELRILEDDSTRGAIEAAMGAPVEVVLLSKQSRAFRLAKRGDHDAIDDHNSLQVSFKWRFAQPYLNRSERTARLFVRKADYDALVADDAFRDDD